MSDIFDKAKDLAKDLESKARGAVNDHSDTIDGGIDKAAEFVDDKTKRKYSDKIDTVQSKAHAVVEKIAEGSAAEGDAGDTPPKADAPDTPTDETPDAGSQPG